MKLFCLALLASLLSCLGADSSAPTPRKRVLILGDSISIGYTPFVREILKDEAIVVRPTLAKGGAENCDGTTKGVKEIGRWLQIDGGNWDVIHFNFGLHDLKRVEPGTQKASNNSNHPRQAEPEVYEKQLREIVSKLKATNARLIFATTTPVPKGGVKPHRDVEDVPRYNEIAARVMKENGVAIDDLYAFALPRLGEIQQKVNVHFTPAGSKALAEEVARHLREALKK